MTSARWDAEWLPWLYSFAEFAHQNQDMVFTSLPDSLDALFAGESELTSATLGLNLWLNERFGLSLARRLNRSRIIDPANRGNALALIPRNTFSAGLTRVHPSQLRLSAVVGRIGERAVDNANSAWLSSYWSTSVSARWQFLDKRASAALSINNLFDRHFELARGTPSAGRAALFSLEARF